MQPNEYLKQSENTLAEQDEEQRTMFSPQFVHALELAHAGNACDFVKRDIYYKDENALERFSKQIDDINKIRAKFKPGTEGTLYSQEDTDLFHAALGVGSEAGEIMEAILSHMNGDELDETNIKEEVGDVLWYLAIFCRRCNFTLEEAMQTNIDKLAARYPEKFTCEDAVNRDIQNERKVLEG